MAVNVFDLLQQECPQIAASYGELVESQRQYKGLDARTKLLINIAIQTANRNVRGVALHAQMARKQGISKAEVVGAVVMNLHLSGSAAVLDCLPGALEAFEGNDDASVKSLEGPE